jgi:hypothetical protein
MFGSSLSLISRATPCSYVSRPSIVPTYAVARLAPFAVGMSAIAISISM